MAQHELDGIPLMPFSEVKATCRPCTADCCRYLLIGTAGWGCGKHSTIRDLIDQKVAAGKFKATGDNCPGYGRKLH